MGGLNNKITNNCEKGSEKFTRVFQALGLLVKCSYSLFIIGKNMLDLMQIVNQWLLYSSASRYGTLLSQIDSPNLIIGLIFHPKLKVDRKEPLSNLGKK